jgi:hypothetical protein
MPPYFTSRDRDLERALLANFVVHGLALLGMVLFLLPALPGGGGATDAERITYIADHAWRFRLGWLPWQLCAVADVLLAIAMVRTPWLPRPAALLVLALTLAAVVPDQVAQALWITRGVDLARTDPAAYLAFERGVFPLTAGWAALLYTLAGLAWTWSFARGGAWSRLLTWLSVPLWATMLIAVVAPLLPAAHRPSPAFVGAANALGFAQLQLWLALVGEQVMRRTRPFEDHGRLARWRHPGRGPLARLWDALANSRFAHAITEPLPELAMRSDITDVVYVNYLVPAAVAQRYLPPDLELQRLGPNGEHALFTFLTYRHGNFGVRALGPLRRLFPSPVHTNWRVHVVDPVTQHRGIYFVTNAISSTPLALAARMMSEGMPMHVVRAEHRRGDGGELIVRLDPGAGTGPDADLALRPADAPPAWTGAWAACFPSWRDFLAYCVPQDRALASQPHKRRVSRQEIDLGIALDACTPLAGTVSSRAARAIAGDAEPVCFHVAAVRFEFSRELHDPR